MSMIGISALVAGFAPVASNAVFGDINAVMPAAARKPVKAPVTVYILGSPDRMLGPPAR
jgi:hypothetical protein